MTSAHSMLPRFGATLRSLHRALALTCLSFAGCASEPLSTPQMLTGPSGPDRTWAVAPFLNESGTSTVDPIRVADLFAHELEQVRRINVVPVDRVLRAMTHMQMTAVTSPRDADALMGVLDVDGLIVGTITAYDPYPPLTLGAAVQLYARGGRTDAGPLDPQALTRAPRDEPAPALIGADGPLSQASGVFDATNHLTLQWLDGYASGRNDPEGAYGKDVYLASMEMYTRFVSFRLIRTLLYERQLRLTSVEESGTR